MTRTLERREGPDSSLDRFPCAPSTSLDVNLGGRTAQRRFNGLETTPITFLSQCQSILFAIGRALDVPLENLSGSRRWGRNFTESFARTPYAMEEPRRHHSAMQRTHPCPPAARRAKVEAAYWRLLGSHSQCVTSRRCSLRVARRAMRLEALVAPSCVACAAEFAAASNHSPYTPSPHMDAYRARPPA